MRACIERTISNVPKLGLVVEGLALLILGLGFAVKNPAVTWLWPSPNDPMTGILLSALLVSYGSGSIFVACTVDWRAATSGGALALVVGFGGFALAIASDVVSGNGNSLLPQAIVLGLIAVGSAYAFYASQRFAPQPAPRAPLWVRATLLILAVGLALMGYGLLAGWHGMLPWRVDAATSTLFGWLFVGFAADYVLTAQQGNRSACEALLFALVVYNSVLILPLLHGMATASPDDIASLTENLFGIVATTLFSGYFLWCGYGQTWKWTNVLSA